MLTAKPNGKEDSKYYMDQYFLLRRKEDLNWAIKIKQMF